MDNSKPFDREDIKNLLLLATLAGRIMLKNGAETYRVEDTVIRICKSRGDIKYVDAFVIPTGIFISLEYKGELMTYIKRIKYIATNLNKIDMVNEFSRSFVNSDMSIAQGLEDLKKINKMILYNKYLRFFCGAMASSFFCTLFGGTPMDSVGSFLSSFLVLSTLDRLLRLELTFFLNTFTGAILASGLSYVMVRLGISQNLDKVIIGSIMCLLPGVAITNSIRDTMSGDYISGLSRGMEAVFSAAAIAFGVGIILNFYLKGVI